MEQRLLVLLAESPVHAGAAAAEAALDSPIQRDTATGLPVIWGQSLKGALRDAARGQDWEQQVFGSRPPGSNGAAETDPARPRDGGSELTPGQVSFGDAQLVAFPAATLQRTFAWTTSRLLLNRLRRKASLLGADIGAALDPIGGTGALGRTPWRGRQVVGPYLDEVTVDEAVGAVGAFLAALACPVGPDFDYTRTKLAQDLLVISDDAFTDLTRLGTDVVARVQLNDDKTVRHGPFHVEYLPVETVLATVLSSGREGPLQQVQEFFDGRALQLGGDESIGKGLVWCRVLDRDTTRAAATSASAEVVGA